MGHLHIKVLGTPEVRHEGRVLKFRSRKVLALLLYLAVEGHRVAREKISVLLWPESDEAAARSTLRRALADLRAALDDSPAHTHLVVEREALAFAFAPGDELDVRAVDSAFDLLRQPVSAGEQAPARQALLHRLQQAVQLSNGSFLEGFSPGDAPDFDDWVGEQRAALQRRMSLVYERLAHMQAERGNVLDAIETIGRWLVHDPLQESAYQRLMSLYLTAGNYRAALSVYEDCRKVLAEELRARPLPETQALAERIRRAARGTGASAEAAKPLSFPAVSNKGEASAVEPSSRAMLIVPMVGRSNEHLALVDVYQRVRQGQAQVVFITGEAGVGKTRLTRAFLGWAEAQGADVLHARAFETSGRLPYHPLVESLRPRLERENAPDDLLSDTWLAELTRLFPELRDRYPDLPPATGDETTARLRLYEAVTRLGSALANHAPIVLSLDDLHWADTATLDVLSYAARRWQKSHSPLLLLLNLRGESLASSNTLADWMASLQRDTGATHIQLDALTLEETLHLLETLALRGDERERERIEIFGRWLFAETHGQPLYLTETLKALLERGLLARILQDDGRWRVDFLTSTFNEATLRRFLPPGVREVIRVRLNQLTPDSFALLVAGAVLGRDARFEQLCLVAGLDEQAGLVALDELLRSRFLREGNDGDAAPDPAEDSATTGTYYFTHDRVRDVVYSEAGEARRRVFHRRALEGLPSAPAAERAQHAHAAALHAHAFDLYVAAGHDAMQMFAVNDASLFYEQALRLLPKRQEPGSPSVLQQVYSQLGRAYELMNRTEQAGRTYRDMLTYAQHVRAIEMECVALCRMAILTVQVQLDFEQAASLLQQALRRAEQINDKALMADVECHLAQLGFYDFDAPVIVDHSQRALALARELGSTELMARSLNILSYGKKQNGLFGEAEHYAREARTLYQTIGNRAMEVDSICVIADILLNRGQVEEGVALAQTAYDISLKIGNAWGQVNAMYHLALGALERDEPAEALELAHRCVALTEEFKLGVLQVNSYILLGIVQRTLQMLDEARATHLTALHLAEDMTSPALTATAAIELCADYALPGQWEDAAACAIQGATGTSNLFVLAFGLSRWYVTEALVRAGHIQLAAEDLAHWQARIIESPRHRIPYLRAAAILAHAQGQPEQASAFLQEALSIARSLRLSSEQQALEVALQALPD